MSSLTLQKLSDIYDSVKMISASFYAQKRYSKSTGLHWRKHKNSICYFHCRSQVSRGAWCLDFPPRSTLIQARSNSYIELILCFKTIDWYIFFEGDINLGRFASAENQLIRKCSDTIHRKRPKKNVGCFYHKIKFCGRLIEPWKYF